MQTTESATESIKAPNVYIDQLNKYEGQTVTVRGWLIHHRDKKKLQFLVVRDGTGTVQAVAFQDDLPPETWELFRDLTQESALIITGKVRKDDRAPGGYERSDWLAWGTDWPKNSISRHGRKTNCATVYRAAGNTRVRTRP